MPVPKPREGEEQQPFISRCISELSHEDPNADHDQIVAICHDAWRDSLKQDIMGMIHDIREPLLRVFGDAGRAYFDWTVELLATVTDLPKPTITDGVPLEQRMRYPNVKTEKNGDLIFENMPMPSPVGFKIINEEERIVAGYANVPVADCVRELFWPEAYKESAEAYTEREGFTFYNHWWDTPSGKVLKHPVIGTDGLTYQTHVDEIGWFVVSQVTPEYWEYVKKGMLKAYSIGYRYVAKPVVIGQVDNYFINSIKILEVSHVFAPCNRLTFFNTIKSKLTGKCPCNSQSQSPCRIETSRTTGPNTARDKGQEKTGERLIMEPETPKTPPETPIETPAGTNATPPETPSATPPAEPKELKDMTAEELKEHADNLLSEQEKRGARKFVERLEASRDEQEAAAKKAKEESQLNKMLEEQKSQRVDLAQIKADLAIITGRVTKMEHEPAMKGPPEGPETGNVDRNDPDYWIKVEAAFQKQKEKETVGLFNLPPTIPSKEGESPPAGAQA